MSDKIGVVAKKLGMTHIYDDSGNQVPVTLLMIEDAVVMDHKMKDRDGYAAVRIACGGITTSKHLSKSVLTLYKKADLKPRRIITEFRVKSEDQLLKSGTEITTDNFKTGQYVDIQGYTVGKGFAGSMKRHGFGGLCASHGVSVSHRAHGSTGGCQDPGRVFKGKKMAGQMGNTKMTQQNLQIVRIDNRRNLIFIKGSVPGKRGTNLRVTHAIKKEQI